MVMNEVCRCCLSETCFKDISNEYVMNGTKEVYAEMLLNTYNIEISYQDSNSRLICEDCIMRLRDAAAFKKQVIQVEEAITKGISIGAINDVVKLKDERDDDFLDHITGEFEYESVQQNSNDDDDSSCWNNEDLERDDENIFLIKLDPEDDDIPLRVLQRSKVTKNKLKVSNIKKGNVRKKTDKTKAEQQKARKKTLPQSDRKENSLKLITNSNICLFDSMKTKYRCFYCRDSYLNIMDLREHTLTHYNASYLKMCINRLQGMSYKCVDISNLACRICSTNLKDLTDLKEHLKKEHDIKFAGEENNMLIPYRLDDGFGCVMCEQRFNTFFKLSVHMNTHYTNHVCEVCGASYINRLSLRMHVNSRHRESKCAHCSATFPNAYLRVKHMRKTHKTAESKRYCLLCDKTFRYSYMLEEHRIQEHGKKRAVSVCSECGKTFLSPINLRTHIRCVHNKERNYPCPLCGMCFFTSCDQRRHERTHQDVRSFACSYCYARFKSKDSLRRHLKRQHGHLV